MLDLRKYKKINIIGTSGSGKSIISKKLAEILDYEYIEMDDIFWGPNWSKDEHNIFLNKLKKELEKDKWVLDGNYKKTIPIKWKEIELIIWIDYSFIRTLFQISRRAIQRLIKNDELWLNTGNKETIKSLLSKKSIILFMLKSYFSNKKLFNSYVKNNKYKFIRLKSPKEVNRFLNNIK